ncbi:MAG TPA: nucleoside hydrolase, partial [Dehalococcoidia bacterium]|nr:nucleoside hydrolase [Dehalococcoidia bacterium]
LRGSREPFDERPWFADRVHGEFGLDGVNLPEPGVDLTPGHAVDFIIDRARSSEELAIIALGPLTNVAAVLQREPALTSGISGIWLMGGSFGPGNVSPAAEFNIAFDPEAADVVFAAGIPLRMCGLNLTRQVGAGDKEINRFRAISNRIGPVVADLVQFHRKRTRDVYGSDTVPIHDACAVASFVAPELITFRRMHVGVELRGEQTRGMTVCDARFADVSRPDWAPVPNADVGIEIDREGFFNLLCDSLVAYD